MEFNTEKLDRFTTKAADVDENVDMQHYLLGNQFELIEELKRNSNRVN